MDLLTDVPGNHSGTPSEDSIEQLHSSLKLLHKQIKFRQSAIHELAEGNYGNLPEDTLPEIQNSDFQILQKKLQNSDDSLNELEWIYSATQDLREVQTTSFDVKDYANLILPEIADKIPYSKAIFFYTVNGYSYEIASSNNLSASEREKYLNSINTGVIEDGTFNVNKVTFSNLSLCDSKKSPLTFDGEDRMYVFIPLISSGEIIEGLIELTLEQGLEDKQIKYLREIKYSIAHRLVFCRTLSRSEDLLENTLNQAAEIRKQSEQLQKFADELQQTSTYKSQFIARVSHEVRTPLNCITGMTELLKKNKKENLLPDQIESLDLIYQSALDLADIINDLLDIGKIEAGKLAIEPEEVDVRKINSYLQKTFQPLADAKFLEFSATVANNVPETLLTDPKRLQQILKNLLSNALKFTFEGEVSLKIEKSLLPSGNAEEIPSEDAVVFTVKDSGVGISEEQQTTIWEAFEQADGSTTRIYGGTGLGLTISKELTRLLGGKTTLNSEVGKGSTFSLYLPIPKSNVLKSTRTPFLTENRNATTSGTYLTNPDSAQDQIPLDGRHVLLVDDIHRNLKFTSEFLEDEGMKVSTATNGIEAIDLIEKFPDSYDIVLMDMMMPQMDGFEATSIIRQNHSQEKLPIIALTAMVMQEDQRRCLEAGCNHILAKPIHSETLIRTIQKSLSPPNNEQS